MGIMYKNRNTIEILRNKTANAVEIGDYFYVLPKIQTEE
jgi:hypothetical protein